MTPKPLIEVAGTPMIRRATGSLSFFALVPPENIVAVVRPEDVEDYQIDRELRTLFPGITVLTDENPCGATGTALVARDYIPHRAHLLIMDGDIWFRSAAYEELLLDPCVEVAGAIPVFTAEGERWSFSAVDASSLIKRIIEKRRIEVPGCTLLANVGFYYFSQGANFLKYAEAALEQTPSGAECYLSNVVQEMIEDGLAFRAAMCESVMDMGTPASHSQATAYFAALDSS